MKKKINYLNIFLVILLLISLGLYVKLYIFKSDVTVNVVDLKDEITDVTWYEYGTLAKMRFSSGSFLYELNKDKANDKKLADCNHYTYDEDEDIVSLNCHDYVLKLDVVSPYKMIVTINDKNVYTYYNSLELTKYIVDNNLKNITDEEIEKVMSSKDFTISKSNKSEEYKNMQMSKLSSIDEMTISDYFNYVKEDHKAIIMLINPNMNINSYDLIPIFLNWKNTYADYDFFYINGTKLALNDYTLLEEDEELKDYLTGLYNNNVLVLNNGEVKRVGIDINLDEYEEKVFNCDGEECNDIPLKIYDVEKEYANIEEVLK